MSTRWPAACWTSLCCRRPATCAKRELLRALRDGGGSDPQVWPTTALAMADGQTGALSLAARIAANPEELPLAVAELLRARIEPRTGRRQRRGAAPAGRGRDRPEDPDGLARPDHVFPARRAVHTGGVRPRPPAGRARRDPGAPAAAGAPGPAGRGGARLDA